MSETTKKELHGVVCAIVTPLKDLNAPKTAESLYEFVRRRQIPIMMLSDSQGQTCLFLPL